MALEESAFESGVLDPEVHERLIADIDRILKRAGISAHRHLIWTPLATNCTKREVQWMKAFHDLTDDGWIGLALGPDYPGRTAWRTLPHVLK
ncbi:MAG: hypothetical protein IH898_08595 [Planctomycetes bacterium]|nr:hypothetical protein [Planctomycetota bacterium]